MLKFMGWVWQKVDPTDCQRWLCAADSWIYHESNRTLVLSATLDELSIIVDDQEHRWLLVESIVEE